ncbi:DUF4429 domain-containing protein [Micromonospora sp. NPDC048930]|uniref:DUF4429 domain-containing protein n=1 Tax=Micromonospora sp. NPDC048930 TaxID=3364261 RepID=UPI00371BE6E6
MSVLEARGQNGTVTFDGTFVTITRTGMARLTIGKGDKRIPVATITAVQWKPPGSLVNGFIQFTIPGGNEQRSRAGSQTFNAAQDENSVLFTGKQRPAFEQLRHAVEQAIAQRYAAPQQYAPAPAQSSVADELTKLGQLVQQGLLSREEFEAQKARLLGR